MSRDPSTEDYRKAISRQKLWDSCPDLQGFCIKALVWGAGASKAGVGSGAAVRSHHKCKLKHEKPVSVRPFLSLGFDVILTKPVEAATISKKLECLVQAKRGP